MKLVQDVFLDAMKEKRRKLHRLLKTEGKSPIFILAYYYRKFLDRKQHFYRAITQSFFRTSSARRTLDPNVHEK
jgi:hypothetical protein